MPDFTEIDVRIDRDFVFDRFVIAAYLEVLNLTYSRSVFDVQYPTGHASDVEPVKPVGFRWVLPSLGLRGRF